MTKGITALHYTSNSFLGSKMYENMSSFINVPYYMSNPELSVLESIASSNDVVKEYLRSGVGTDLVGGILPFLPPSSIFKKSDFQPAKLEWYMHAEFNPPEQRPPMVSAQAPDEQPPLPTVKQDYYKSQLKSQEAAEKASRDIFEKQWRVADIGEHLTKELDELGAPPSIKEGIKTLVERVRKAPTDEGITQLEGIKSDMDNFRKQKSQKK
jgi:hypothetical protein